MFSVLAQTYHISTSQITFLQHHLSTCITYANNSTLTRNTSAYLDIITRQTLYPAMESIVGAALQVVAHLWVQEPEAAAEVYATVAAAVAIPHYAPTFSQAKLWFQMATDNEAVTTSTDGIPHIIDSLLVRSSKSVITVVTKTSTTSGFFETTETPLANSTRGMLHLLTGWYMDPSDIFSTTQEQSASETTDSSTSTCNSRGSSSSVAWYPWASDIPPSTASATVPVVLTTTSSGGFFGYFAAKPKEQPTTDITEVITSTSPPAMSTTSSPWHYSRLLEYLSKAKEQSAGQGTIRSSSVVPVVPATSSSWVYSRFADYLSKPKNQPAGDITITPSSTTVPTSPASSSPQRGSNFGAYLPNGLAIVGTVLTMAIFWMLHASVIQLERLASPHVRQALIIFSGRLQLVWSTLTANNPLQRLLQHSPTYLRLLVLTTVHAVFLWPVQRVTTVLGPARGAIFSLFLAVAIICLLIPVYLPLFRFCWYVALPWTATASKMIANKSGTQNVWTACAKGGAMILYPLTRTWTSVSLFSSVCVMPVAAYFGRSCWDNWCQGLAWRWLWFITGSCTIACIKAAQAYPQRKMLCFLTFLCGFALPYVLTYVLSYVKGFESLECPRDYLTIAIPVVFVLLFFLIRDKNPPEPRAAFNDASTGSSGRLAQQSKPTPKAVVVDTIASQADTQDNTIPSPAAFSETPEVVLAGNNAEYTSSGLRGVKYRTRKEKQTDDIDWFEIATSLRFCESVSGSSERHPDSAATEDQFPEQQSQPDPVLEEQHTQEQPAEQHPDEEYVPLWQQLQTRVAEWVKNQPASSQTAAAAKEEADAARHAQLALLEQYAGPGIRNSDESETAFERKLAMMKAKAAESKQPEVTGPRGTAETVWDPRSPWHALNTDRLHKEALRAHGGKNAALAAVTKPEGATDVEMAPEPPATLNITLELALDAETTPPPINTRDAALEITPEPPTTLNTTVQLALNAEMTTPAHKRHRDCVQFRDSCCDC
ncbi:hypothetical protein BDW02DRAFT_355969 [Decorospora gaudefroyi]|uniref:Uncharacterized protein n=1 Tax=Decorospora gaudefroyi TaxID=184978 RepID=A0A6A5KCA6_9PLEO|nr:hypothetical protein BDW02DRAFT_355969 [Decorospora gaudefroyi]